MNAPERGPHASPGFTGVERIAHWVNAVLFTIAMFTGAMFYFGWGQSLISDRVLVRTIHVYSGLAIVVAFAIAIIPRWGRSLRADDPAGSTAGRVTTFGGSRRSARTARSASASSTPARSSTRSSSPRRPLILAGTGSIMYWNQSFSTDLRTGADFVHDWFGVLIWITVFGHIVLAFNDLESLRGMTGGTVSTAVGRAPPAGLV